MTYLERSDSLKKRSNPKLILPGCKSVIMVGIPYGLISQPTEANPEYKFAAYARFQDYHIVIPERLKVISSLISDISSGKYSCIISTDSAPFMEREFAQRAGLGWIGKNSCLISPHAGSLFLIAEILTDLELPIDEPFTEDFCGKCNQCIKACPTGCIQPDRTLDARNCISYLTIEHKGQIPIHLRSKIGKWIFGCDICQSVCPWNRKVIDPRYNSLPRSNHDFGGNGLAEIINMNEENFQITYKKSPILRSKRQGLLRNAAVVMGNLSKREYIPVLEKIITEEMNPVIREQATWALEKIVGDHIPGGI